MGKRGDSRRRARLKRRLAATEHDCWLCLFPLDFTLHWLDPMAVEVDEELPASKGGDVYGRRTPCHLVHRCCNIEKADRVLPHGALHGWMLARVENEKRKTKRTSTSREW